MVRVTACRAVSHEFKSRFSRNEIKNMTLIQTEYYPILVYLLIAAGLALVIFIMSYSVAKNTGETEKLSAYECGFDPFDDARSQFDIRFYLVAMLFLIFDLEASFIFPWVISLGKVSILSYWSIIDFIFELIVGYIYAWNIGALEWE